MGTLLFDVRDALRGLRRDRAYAATVVLTLAITLGATTAMFSIVNGVLLKPLAYPEADRLVRLREVWRELADRISVLELNERHFDYWREHARSFEAMAQYSVMPANLTGVGDAAQILAARTTVTLFDVLKAPVAVGRSLNAADETEARDVAVISDGFWRQRLSADPAALGRAIALDGRAYTIVGILSAGFRLPDRGRLTSNIDVFLPLRIGDVGWVGEHNDDGIARMRPGVTLEQARAELDLLQKQVSEIATKQAHEPVTLSSALDPLGEAIVARARTGLLLLFASVGAVLLIACSNLANLSVTRTIGRLRDAGIRAALGASRTRLVGRALFEEIVLAIAGGTLGLWIAWLALVTFVKTAPVDLPRVSEVALNGQALAFAAFVSIATGFLVAILPAWRLAAGDVQAILRTGGAVAGDRRGMRARGTLLALQVGLSVMLLAVTALLTASFNRLLNVDRGFVAANVLAVEVAMPAARYAGAAVRVEAYDRVIAALHALPGVERVTTTTLLPMAGSGQVSPIIAEGARGPRAEQPDANYRYVAPDFFGTLSMPLVRGRTFTDAERDPKQLTPAVISAPAAARLWPGQDPIGKHFNRGVPGEPGFVVVGVAADARTTSLDRTPPLMVYAPYWWRSRPSMSLLIKSAAAPLSLLPSVRRAIHEIDPEIAIGRVRSVDDLVEASLAGRRYQARLFVTFGAIAMLIAVIGVYATTSYNVSRRRREMNIRAALGARRSQVLGIVLRQSLIPIASGALAGAAGATAAAGVVASLLFEVKARDPFIIGTVVTIVTAIGILACVLAARRGLSLNPAAALRDE